MIFEIEAKLKLKKWYGDIKQHNIELFSKKYVQSFFEYFSNKTMKASNKFNHLKFLTLNGQRTLLTTNE